MGKRFEELEFRDDFMFGVIMRNPKYCKPFLETILGGNISIGDIADGMGLPIEKIM